MELQNGTPRRFELDQVCTTSLLEQECWKSAVEYYNEKLAEDPKQRLEDSQRLPSRCGDTKQGMIPPYSPCASEKLVTYARGEMDRLMRNRARRKCARRLDSLVSWISSYCLVIDVSVQHQPHTTALVWGVIRFAIQVVVQKQRTYREIDTALDLFVQQVGHYRDLLGLYPNESRIHDSVSRVYAWVLKYILLVIPLVSRRGAARVIKATLSQTTQKLGEIRGSISQEQELLNNERHLAFDAAEVTETVNSPNAPTPPDIPLTGGYRNTPGLASTMHQSQREVRVNEVRQALGVPSKPEAIPEPEEGTCAWILQNETHQQWRRCPELGCLLIHGILGCGKSVMFKFLMTTFPEGSVIIHSFRDDASGRGNPGERFALSMLSQVLGLQEVIENSELDRHMPQLRLMAAKVRSGYLPPLNELLRVLNHLLLLVPSVTLLVDALDECNDILRSDMPLTRFLRECGTRSDRRVILFGRNGLALANTLSSPYTITMDQEAVKADIKRFISKRIPNPGLQDMILQKAYNKGEATFLWATLAVACVKPGVTTRICKQLMEKLPARIFEIYEHSLTQSGAHFDKGQYDWRYNIFRLLVATQEHLTATQISTALALAVTTQTIDDLDRLSDPESAILRFCAPLIHITNEGKIGFIHTTVKDFLLGAWHPYPQESWGTRCPVALDDCHDTFAQQTLSALTQERYQSWQYSAHLLEEHLLPAPAPTVAKFRPVNDGDQEFYEYACLHWHDHVAKLEKPTDVVLGLLCEFLGGNAFVAWSETIFDLVNKAESPARQISVRAALQEWHRTTLDPELRSSVPLDDYFLSAHLGLKQELLKKEGDGPLPYLPLVRLGDFYNAGGENLDEWERGYQFTKEVADGYQRVFGERNRLTLTARQKCYQEYLWQMRMDEAEEGLEEVAMLQLEVVGQNEPDYFTTLYYLGAVEFHLTKFADACETLEASATGLQNLLGDVNLRAFQAKLFHGYALEAQGDSTQAIFIYEDIRKRWAENTSDLSGFCLMAETAGGSAYRKQEKFEEARKSLEHSWNQRKRLFTVENNVTVDSGIQLAVLYRDSGDPAKAIEILDEVSKSSIFPKDFERSCQIDHVRSHIDLDNGEYEAAKHRLLERLHQAGDNDREPNNRELLWIRVTLADAMRARGESHHALMLFTNLVKPLSPGELDDEPEPPWRLKVAEEAVRYVKSAEREAAAQLLEKHHLEWQRPRDFWILQGGPISDTSQMAPVRN